MSSSRLHGAVVLLLLFLQPFAPRAFNGSSPIQLQCGLLMPNCDITPGTNLAKEFDELTPKDGEKVIEKIHPSSFADTTLHDYLRGAGSKKVVLTGYMVCVDLR